jgi:hypothetical protein
VFKKVFLFCLLPLVASCTFTPENKYVNPISPPEPISFSIEVNDPEFKSPYYLIGSTQFNFTLKDLSKPVIGYEVVMDGKTEFLSMLYDSEHTTTQVCLPPPAKMHSCGLPTFQYLKHYCPN